MLTLDLDQIEPHPDVTNIRGHNTDDRYLGSRETLKESIRVNGLRQYPVIVRQPTPNGTRYYLADGFRRISCLRELSKADKRFGRVTCVVRDGSTIDVFKENALASVGLEQTRAFAQAMRVTELFDDVGMTNAEISAIFGLKERALQKYRKTVHTTIPGIRHQALQGMVTYSTVRDYVCKQPAEVQEKLVAVIDKAYDPKLARPDRNTRRAVQTFLEKSVGKQVKQRETSVKAPPRTGPPGPPLELTTPKKTATPKAEPKTREAKTEKPVEPAGVTLPKIKEPPKAPETSEEIETQALPARLEKLGVFVEAALQNNIDMNQALGDLGIDVADETPEGAALYGVIEGLTMAALWLSGSTCDVCGEPLVAMSEDRLPRVHSCEE